MTTAMVAPGLITSRAEIVAYAKYRASNMGKNTGHGSGLLGPGRRRGLTGAAASFYSHPSILNPDS
jgi:hypothetical protein